MEASATTENISVEEIIAEPVPDVPKKKRGRPKKAEGVVVTNKSELMEAMKAFGMTLGEQIRRPDVETENERALKNFAPLRRRPQNVK